MRPITSLMSQWKADFQKGRTLHFKKCKGGSFSHKQDYTLRIYGKTLGDRCIKAGSKINCCGKNLFDPLNMWQVATANWITGVATYKNTYQDGKLIGGGDFSNTNGYLISFENEGTNTYTITADCVPNGIPYSGGRPDGGQFFVFQWDNITGSADGAVCVNLEPAGGWITTSTDKINYTFTVTKGYFGFGFNRMWYGDNDPDNQYNALVNVQLERGAATEYQPYFGSAVSVPCDLYEGDEYLPILGIVKRQDGSEERYTPQLLKLPEKTANVFVGSPELGSMLSATHLVRRTL